MRVVGNVRAQFPGLETREALAEHRNTVLGFMARQAALCAEASGALIGVLLFDRENGILCFLAVDPDWRRRHVGTALVRRMLSLLDPGQDVLVTTYCDDVPEGMAARVFYQRLGFVEGRLTEADHRTNVWAWKMVVVCRSLYCRRGYGRRALENDQRVRRFHGGRLEFVSDGLLPTCPWIL